MEMTVKDVLIAARAKIADPANWTQRVSAREVNGHVVAHDDAMAVCWCALGALANVIWRNDIYWAAESALSDAIGGSIHKFNDTHTHAEVLAKFDEAIAAQGGE